MPRSTALTATQIADTAAGLAGTTHVFTRRNLFHAARRRARHPGRASEDDFDAFCGGPLAACLRVGPLPGLLETPRARARAPRLPAEWDAYFPAGILLVDHAPIVALFAASGVLVQARIAVVSLDGYPRHVTDWLCRGLRAGHAAPVAFLHDAATVVYPFAYEPLATWVATNARASTAYRDLGLPPDGSAASAGRRRVFELEELAPLELVSRTARALLAMLPRDAALAPLAQESNGGVP